MPEPELASESLLWKYQERAGDPGFWAEPLNALTNLVFVLAALLAWKQARKNDTQPITVWIQIALAALVGLGSFVFHTIPNQFTLWLDIIPILLFQVVFIWSFCRTVLRLVTWPTIAVLVVVIGAALTLRPIRQPMNGSLFYMPPLMALLALGWTWAEKSNREPWNLFVAATCFSLAVIARSIDWEVDLPIGTHFLWHLLNGVVVYLLLRTIVLFNSQPWIPARQSSKKQLGND